MFKKSVSKILCMTLAAALLVGCSSIPTREVILEAPFTEAEWSLSPGEVIALEGERSNSADYTTTDSVYGGTCYIFPKEYLGCEGSIKYMYDDKNALVCVAWSYGTPDAQAVSDLYEKIHSQTTDKYGEGLHTAKHYSNKGDKWAPESGNILLITFITEKNAALQYSYLHPSVSKNTDGEGRNL